MIEIIPNWHPVLVHFTIGLLLTAAALFAAAFVIPGNAAAAQATTVARWNLWIGTGFAAATIAAGYIAYYTVAHDDPAHAAMLIHLKWAWAAFLLFLVAAAVAWRERRRERGPGVPLAVLLGLASIALIVTGYLGAENVYRHGIGVMRLPQPEGPGHSHAHAESEPAAGAAGHAHDHSTAAAHAPAVGTAALTATADAAAAVVDAFQAALVAGNPDDARKLLDPQVRIYEGGNVERSAEEYASHHLPSDAAFLSGAKVELQGRSGDAVGDFAWIASESRIEPATGSAIASTETMILRNAPQGWRIAHIHWSSRPLPKAEAGHGEPQHDHDTSAAAARPDTHEHDDH